jgi:mannose/fructose/N-acetylgalactosamine-specific phosphotransferase system component IIB
MISFVRIDNRLVHGQVIEGWLPHLKVRRVLVLDREAAQSPLTRASMGLAVPEAVALQISPDDSELQKAADDAVPTLVLFRDVAGAFQAVRHGIRVARLNLGNIHFKSGRHAITASVFLDGEELHELEQLAREGVEIQAQALPSEKPMGLAEMQARFRQNGSDPAC